jgi:hypothetical protein
MKIIKILSLIAISIVLALSVAFFWMTSLKVSGKSMEPTLYDGDTLILNFFSTPKVDDIVVFDCFSKCNSTGKLEVLTKRIIKIDENGCYWVEGDNKDFSRDSRTFGNLCPSDINNVRTLLFKF